MLSQLGKSCVSAGNPRKQQVRDVLVLVRPVGEKEVNGALWEYFFEIRVYSLKERKYCCIVWRVYISEILIEEIKQPIAMETRMILEIPDVIGSRESGGEVSHGLTKPATECGTRGFHRVLVHCSHQSHHRFLNLAGIKPVDMPVDTLDFELSLEED
ncbi:hypothetical protein B0H19DRAFT_1066586 [Mycena capillaripes]|nr:hypothetical protein B0H19DRAFT_1066586 [Mycena capillaripes]